MRRDEAGTAMHLAPRGPADGQTEVLLKTSVTSQNIHSSTTNITRPAHRACGSGFRRAAVGVQFHNRATLCAYGTHCVMCVIAAHDTLWLRCLCAALHCVLQAWGGFARGCGRSDVARCRAQSTAWRCVTPSHFAMHMLVDFLKCVPWLTWYCLCWPHRGNGHRLRSRDTMSKSFKLGKPVTLHAWNADRTRMLVAVGSTFPRPSRLRANMRCGVLWLSVCCGAQ